METQTMTRYSKFALIALSLGLLASANVSAQDSRFFGSSCRNVPFIDVRGNADLDADGDNSVTIAEVASANPLGNVGVLFTAVLAADPLVAEALSNPDANWTVFAPVDSAFLALPPPLLDLLLDPAAQPVLTDILLYHVVAGKFDPRRTWYIRPVDSILGQDLFVKRGRSNPSVNNSEIECEGVRADNGIIWFIDSVLLNQY
jgi:uncharacterized surface protein with fasciclin (FAS1) repeats